MSIFEPRCRVISDNDYSGDPDGLYQLVHHLMCPSVEIRGVIGSHLSPVGGFKQSDATATDAYEKVLEVLELMDLRDTIPAYQGSNVPLVDSRTPQRTAAAEAIVAEAMRNDTDLPLYVVFGAGLTQLASAYLMEPRIAERMTAVWIGGNEYPDLASPPPGAGELEYNLGIDFKAARFVFNETTIPLWQVPRDAYRQAIVGMVELQTYVRPMGKLGAYLYDTVQNVYEMLKQHGINPGEVYVLGDSPLVLLTALQTVFEPDTASSRWVERYAPLINADGTYTPRTSGRKIRVYTDLDIRLMVQDFYTKLAARAAL